mmetsp:Transcript_47804/g.135005  ORF Transcript_47804/g.135005 Transcript_47804/m.135005 type:complete len:264 (-) Transcript_47804:1132-1923(-)
MLFHAFLWQSRVQKYTQSSPSGSGFQVVHFWRCFPLLPQFRHFGSTGSSSNSTPLRTTPKTAPPTPNCFTVSHAALKSSHSSMTFPFSSMILSPSSQPYFSAFLLIWTTTMPASSSSASSSPSPSVPSASVSLTCIFLFGFSFSCFSRRFFLRCDRSSFCTGVRVLMSASMRPSGSSSWSFCGLSSSLSSGASSNSRTARSLRSPGRTSFCSLNIFLNGLSSSLCQMSRQHSMPSCHFVVEVTTANALFWSRVFSSCHRSSSS